MILRQSTSQIIRFGPFLDSTDGDTEETALTIAQADMRLSKDGAAYAQKSAAGNATHDENGNYSTTLSTTDTNTVGELKLYVHVAGGLAVWEKWYVIEEAVYDDLFAASGAGYAGISALATVDTNVDSILVDTAEIGAAGAGLTALATQASVNTVDTNVDSILVDTAEIGAAGAGLTALSTQASVDVIDTNVDQIETAVITNAAGVDIAADIADIPTVSEFNARTLVAASYFDPAADAVANVTLVATTTTNTDMRGTDSALLAANAPSNFAAMVITAGGSVDALVQGYLNTLIAETTAGRISGNFDTFYDNADADTSQVVDDVGAGAGGGTDWTASERNEIRGRLGVTGTTAAGGNTPTLSTQASVDTVDGIVDTIVLDTDELQSVLSAGILARSNNATLESLLGVDDDAAADTLVFQTWEELLTGATHNVNNSAGKRLRQAAAFILADGTLQSATADTAVLAVGSSAVDDFFNHSALIITAGTGAGQERVISDYDGGTVTATITPSWTTNPDATSDYEILPASVHSSTTNGGYDNASVWIDTNNGTAGTLQYVNGTSTRPVSNLADARTIGDSLNLTEFVFLTGSGETLAQSFDNEQFMGSGYSVNLGSQSISGFRCNNAFVTGTDSGSAANLALFRECSVSAVTVANARFVDCFIAGSITGGILGFSNCRSSGTTVPVVDYSTTANQTVSFDHHSGSIEIANLGNTGTDILNFNGIAQTITLAASCTGGTVNLSGIGQLINNGSGMTINQDAWIDLPSINAEADTALADYDGPTNAEMEARTIPSADYFDPAADAVANVTLVSTTTTNTDMRGTDSAATEAKQDIIDTNVDAIKAKTDDLTFTKANELDSNIQSINDAGVVGDGNAVPWDGA